MFSQSLKRAVQSLNFASKRTAIRSVSTVSAEFVNVSVSGKVKDIQQYDEKSLTIYLSSVRFGKYSQTHKILVPTKYENLYKKLKSNLTSDHNLYVDGVLKTKQFENDENQVRSTSVVIATDVRIYNEAITSDNSTNKSEDAAKRFDVNSVEAFGEIVTSIQGDDHRRFILKSSHKKNDKSTNQIFIYDRALFPVIENMNFKKEQILLRGSVEYRIEKDMNGKHVPGSYIKVDQIYRISIV
ncbi:uncharacterized protein LOC116352570 [Contarinia nasturtii]|uniref:uncharacterized protein LOC116352570 n=1 Tax=Contarinia nasturtii TaxID=265458 RepID=UPI0012D4819C|nr:uncharacterized protein LOC116352570 [Contarinia nasturtii]